MMQHNGGNNRIYKIGYLCPFCSFIIPAKEIDSLATKWFPKNYGMSEIKCSVCKNVSLFKEWKDVKYPLESKCNSIRRRRVSNVSSI